ncbi:MAG: glycerol-3-phosphate 1-O-acyltransferase PlsY [Dissulfurispiraceae bacterium]|jgi:glycerol-3-phosphate acyltransferase PlsY|nr:glycerol-3-phosphate 1-O-acyltransferase PlsY [Dissulfurispiraceae bacterium]
MTVMVLAIIAFLIGSIPTGLLIAKAKGIDIRSTGSGNIGATNVMRSIGKESALFTLLGDIAKGAVSVVIGILLKLQHPELAVIGLSAILGHNFSIFLKFRGGKGVATSLGVLLAYSPYVGIFTSIIWLVVMKWSKTSSLSALSAFAVLPVIFFMIDNSALNLTFALVITALIFIRHIDNIKRLAKGQEGGFRRPKQ